MTSANIDPSFGWHEIAEHTFTLWGAGSLTFTARSALSTPDTIHSPAAIAFVTTILVPRWDGDDKPVMHRLCHGFYGSLDKLRDDLAALRQGKADEVKLRMEGFEARIYQHNWGVRSGLCVEGVASSVRDVRQWPWEKRTRKIGDWLLNDNETAFCLRFAFVTSLVDPPCIDNFIRDIDALLGHLALFEG